MPFTFCHPAIVLPFRFLKYFSLTALVIGSMMPDFEYFVRMRIIGEHGHSFLGVFYFDLPLGLLCSFIYHYWIRNSLIENLSYFLKSRLYKYKQFNWYQYFTKHVVIVLCSLLIGIYSHLFWDAFTHGYGYFVQKIPLLQEYIFHKPGYNILQHLSSLIGAIIILRVIMKLLKNNKLKSGIDYAYWIICGIVTIVITLIRFLWEPQLLIIGNIIVTLIFGAILGLIIANFFYKFKKTKIF